MKKISIVVSLFVLFCSSTLLAQQANEILGIAKENKTKEYYEQQSALWKKIAQKSPKDGHAWFQYYKARRAYLQRAHPQTWLNNQGEIFNRLKPIIAQTHQHTGNSFEYYLMEAVNTTANRSAPYLKKAYQIAPERNETYENLLIHYALRFQNEQAAEMAKKMLAQNYYSNANLKWNYNALQTAAPNSVYITIGDMDGIPKWVLQHGKGIRKDVLVVSKWMMSVDEDYRKKVFEKVGIQDLNKSKDDFGEFADYADALVIHLLKNSSRPVYMGCGTGVKFFKKHGIANQMYLVGTAFLYSREKFDNLAVMIKNFEQKYDLEYLLNNFQYHADDEVVRKYMNVTYLPGLMKLKRHFEKTDEAGKVDYYKKLVMRIAEDSGRKDEVMSWF